MWDKMWKWVLFLGMLVVFVAFGVLALFWATEFVLGTSVHVNLSKVATKDQWASTYAFWAVLALVLAAILGSIWFWVAQTHRDAHWATIDNRMLWLNLWVVCPILGLLTAIWPMIFLQRGYVWVVLPNILFTTLAFYLATLLFSPAAFAYTPWLARKIRRW